MFAETRNQLDARVLPLWNAVFCLDCEVISSSQGDECPACKSRSLVSLARMLGGSLLAHRAQHSQERESGLFDITIVVELQQMHASRKGNSALFIAFSCTVKPEYRRNVKDESMSTGTLVKPRRLHALRRELRSRMTSSKNPSVFL